MEKGRERELQNDDGGDSFPSEIITILPGIILFFADVICKSSSR